MIKDGGLRPKTLAIIRDKNTELPLSGEYNDFEEVGSYLCRRCGLALFRSNTKFHAGCGWPSFDETLPGAVAQKQDADGRRMEILCTRCDAHLGHVFYGESFTAKNTRYCVNSLSLDFVSDLEVTDSEEAIFAGGCFWGVDYLFSQVIGVLKVEAGYIGGHQPEPSYEMVCAGNTGHFEAVRILYNPIKVNYKTLAKYFFEIHDPFQMNGQGPDIGSQYLSAIFYYDEKQKQAAESLINALKNKYQQSVATKLLPISPFWLAETYHQHYYKKTKKQPYCHRYTKKFD